MIRAPLPRKLSVLPIVGAVAVGSVLLVTALFIWSTVREASETLARGAGSSLAMSARSMFRDPDAWPLTRADLDAFLADHAADGLRYVGVIDGSGRAIAEAGEARMAREGPVRMSRPPDLEFDGTRARLVHPVGSRQRRGVLGPDRDGPSRLWIAYEFEPRHAVELQRLARSLLAVSVVSFAGIVAFALALSRTLTQRVQLTAELERGKRLASLGAMSAVLAHELKNPLASLKGHAQLLAEDVEQDAKLSPKVQRLVNESVRIEQLLTDLLTFVKTGELQLADVQPDDVLRAAVEAVGSERIDARYLGRTTRWRADGGRIQQALENLLRNAVQASPDDQRVEVAVEASDREIRFIVRDRGSGLPPGDEERIFEPFVTTRVRGVGLGLAITRRIAELHGGRVTGSNRAGGGAEFQLVLPERR